MMTSFYWHTIYLLFANIGLGFYRLRPYLFQIYLINLKENMLLREMDDMFKKRHRPEQEQLYISELLEANSQTFLFVEIPLLVKNICLTWMACLACSLVFLILEVLQKKVPATDLKKNCLSTPLQWELEGLIADFSPATCWRAQMCPFVSAATWM